MALTVGQVSNPTLTGVATASPGSGLIATGSSPTNGLGTNTTNPQLNVPTGGTGIVSGSATGGVGTYPNSNGGTGGGGTAVDPQIAINAAKVATYRSAITGLAKNILDVYDLLYGAANTAGADQAKQVNQKYDTETAGLTDQYNQDIPIIGNSFSARGAYDSSYRQDAQGNATNAFNRSLDAEGVGRTQDLAKVGQFVAETQGNINAEKGGVNAVLAHINETDDPNELLSIQNAIQAKLQSAQSDQASLGTQGGYAAKASALAPATDNSAQLRSQLSTIIAGQAAAPLKNSVGQKLIASSGLSPEDQNKLAAEFAQQVAIADKNQQG